MARATARPRPARNGGAAAVAAAEFGRLLNPLLDPQAPLARIAVAVSGGADSMALALLCRDWAAKRGVGLTALIVDHRLRPESTREARQVAAWLKAAGIPHRILAWRDEAKPSANRQAAAREARYALLQAHCRRHRIRHLLLAHHRDDQAETFLLRALRGSGLDGLAGMAARRRLDDGLVLLRPLLDLPKARLVATLKKCGQPWIEDPSNADPAYARVRVRQALDLLAGEDAAARAELVTHLAQSARNIGRARAALAEDVYATLRAAITVSPAGFALLDSAPFQDAADEVALRALAQLLMAVGGQALPPRLERLERLLDNLRDGLPAPQSLHRCSLRRLQVRILVCREARHLPPPQELQPGASLLWDGRFAVTLGRRAPAGLVLKALGSARPPLQGADPVPRAAWPSLPSFWRGEDLLAVPALGFGDLPPGTGVVFRPSAANDGVTGEAPAGEIL